MTATKAAHSPNETVNETRRLMAHEIFVAAVENARGELDRSMRKLAFSGIAAESPWA